MMTQLYSPTLKEVATRMRPEVRTPKRPQALCANCPTVNLCNGFAACLNFVRTNLGVSQCQNL